MMKRYFIYFLLLAMVSCGSQKALLRISDEVIQQYLDSKNASLGIENVYVVNEPLDEGLLEQLIYDKYNFYKDYNSSPIYPTVGDTLKRIFSEENLAFFKTQFNKQGAWSEKSYIKQTIINRKDKIKIKYGKKAIFSFSRPVLTLDKKYAIARIALDHRSPIWDEYIIFKKQKNKWVIYRRGIFYL